MLLVVHQYIRSLAYSLSAISVIAGCPNITGSVRGGDTTSSGGTGASGCFRGTEANVEHYATSSSGSKIITINFNASHSNSIYGSSTTVTPLSLKTKFFIKY